MGLYASSGFPELVLQGPCSSQSAPQPFFGSSRNAPPLTLTDDTKNGCEADYVNPFLTKLICCSRYGLVLFAFLLMSTSPWSIKTPKKKKKKRLPQALAITHIKHVCCVHIRRGRACIQVNFISNHFLSYKTHI